MTTTSEPTYFDVDGQSIELDALVRKEPEWAANRIREERRQREQLQTERDALQADNFGFAQGYLERDLKITALQAKVDRLRIALAATEGTQEELDSMTAERDELKHDIARHLRITATQAQEIEGLRDIVRRLVEWPTEPVDFSTFGPVIGGGQLQRALDEIFAIKADARKALGDER